MMQITNYWSQNKCKDCGKLITNYAKRCRSCRGKSKKHLRLLKKNFKNNKGRIIHGKLMKDYYCKICNKKVTRHAGVYGQSTCPSCSSRKRSLTMWKNPKIRIKLLKGLKIAQKINNKKYKNRINLLNKHHIFLDKNLDFIMLPQGIHIKLHGQSYRILVETNLIEKYFKWFQKKFKINFNKYNIK